MSPRWGELEGTASRGRPLKRLFVFTTAILVGAFLFHGFSTWQETREATFRDLIYVDQLLRQTLREVFRRHQSMLEVLGERLAEVDAAAHPSRGRDLVDRMPALNPGMAGFGLARPDGQLVLVSGVPEGHPLPNLLEQDQTAPGFREALTARELVLGHTYYMPLLRRWVVPFRAAVRDDNGAPVLVMTAGMDADSPATTWNALGIAHGIEVRLLRQDGYWQFVAPLGDEDKHQVYDVPAARRFQSLLQSEPGPSGHWRRDDLTIGNRESFAVGGRLPGLKLNTLVSVPRDRVLAEFLRRMLLPGLLFLMAGGAGFTLYGSVSRHQKDFERRLVHVAQHDDLTGLPNRMLLTDRLERAMGMADREGWKVAVFFLDLDRFKRINDSYGHAVGDALLRQCATRLRQAVRSVDTLGRLGGDEFLVIAPDLESPRAAEPVATRMLRLFDEPFDLSGRQLFSSVSLGIAIYPDDGVTAGEILRKADTALYRAKDKGRNGYVFYAEHMNVEAERHLLLETELRWALMRKELFVVYQPVVSLATGRWLGAEALVRWHSARLGEIAPSELIPIAEETGLIHDIGRFVLSTALEDLKRMRALQPDFYVSVNLSVVQLRDGALAVTLASLLQEHTISPHHVALEVGESVLAEEARSLGTLRDLGLKIAVDDFGSGYSSLSGLKLSAVSALKIDRTLVHLMDTDIANRALSKAIITLAGELGLDVIAEGVERPEEAECLLAQGCSTGQGRYLGAPMPIDDLIGSFPG